MQVEELRHSQGDEVLDYVRSEARSLVTEVVGQKERRTIRRPYLGNGPLVWIEYSRNSDHVVVQLKNPRVQTNIWLGSL